MKLYNPPIIFLLLSINLGNIILCDNKVDLFIAISLSGEKFQPITKQIIQNQHKIQKAASDAGYTLNPLVKDEDLHITLERIQNVDVKDVPKYHKCIRKAVYEMETFDISMDIEKSSFGILGNKRKWGVLQLNTPKKCVLTPKKCALSKLRKLINHCLWESELQTGIYDEFVAHISLGTFSDKNTSIPNTSNLAWVPKIVINATPNQPAVIDQVYLNIRDLTTNKESTELLKFRKAKRQQNKQSTHPLEEKNSCPTEQKIEPQIEEQEKINELVNEQYPDQEQRVMDRFMDTQHKLIGKQIDIRKQQQKTQSNIIERRKEKRKKTKQQNDQSLYLQQLKQQDSFGSNAPSSPTLVQTLQMDNAYEDSEEFGGLDDEFYIKAYTELDKKTRNEK